MFYASNGIKVGSKQELFTIIAEVTGIPTDFLLGKDLRSASVAQRMSWAARRNASRVEDIAYCLLGLFNINIPLIYGEREKAFRRLREEILKVIDDQSIFAWTTHTEPTIDGSEDNVSGLLAYSPAQFKHSGSIVRSPTIIAGHYSLALRTFITINSKGIGLALPLLPTIDETDFITVLNCRDTIHPPKWRAKILLRGFDFLQVYMRFGSIAPHQYINIDEASLTYQPLTIHHNLLEWLHQEAESYAPGRKDTHIKKKMVFLSLLIWVCMMFGTVQYL